MHQQQDNNRMLSLGGFSKKLPRPALLPVILLTMFGLLSPCMAEEEGETLAWHVAQSDTTYRMDQHERSDESPRLEGTSEFLRLHSAHGTYVHLARSITPSPIIDELELAVWILADRPGLQVLVRVVLPRTLDPQTGEPITTLIRGSMYHQVGQWQRLTVDNFPLLLSRHVRVLRSQYGSQVDGREAYVDQVLVNAYGGAGVTTLWLSETEVDGHVSTPTDGRVEEGTGVSHAAFSENRSLEEASQFDSNPVVEVDLHNSVMTVSGRPFFPRAIEHNGEPFDWLAGRGFNTILLSSTPTPSQLAESERLGIWLVCPPPKNREGEETEADYRRVIAWNLGDELTTRHFESVRQEASDLRRVEDLPPRPLLASPDTDLFRYSCSVDLLLLGRRPLGTSLELSDYIGWLEGRQQLVRPGTPSWVRIQTEVDPSIQNQLAALTGGAATPLAVEPEQIRLLVRAALATKARGIVFASQSRLDTDDPQTRMRASVLELANLELYLVEPWVSGSVQFSQARCSDPQLRVSVLQTERSRLLLPLPLPRQSQHVAGGDRGEDVTIVAPGVPEANAAYLLRPAGLKRLRPRRVTGGIQFSLDAEKSRLPILITHDPLILSSIVQRQAVIGQRAASLRRDLAHQMLVLVENVDRQVTRLGISVESVQSDIVVARQHLRRCDSLLIEEDLASADEQASLALLRLAQARARHWQAAVLSSGAAHQSAFATQFPTLPYFWKTSDIFEAAPRGGNRLPGGELETLRPLVDSGWRNFRDPPPGIETHVDMVLADQALSESDAWSDAREVRREPGSDNYGRRGANRFALRLRAWALQEDAGECEVATPPVWVTTAAVPVEAGEIIEIRGRVHLPESLTGSRDGLVLFDSLGGQALAQRVYRSEGWTEFVMLRAAEHATDLTLTIALSGLGEAWIDDLSIRTVRLNTVPF